MKPLSLYYVDMKYVRNLSKVSDKVPSVSPQIGKENRPFLGVITVVDNKSYCIPISSPKPKYRRIKSPIDMIKVFDESRRGEDHQFFLIGVLNLNNMIPVSLEVIKEVDITIHGNDSPETKHYKELMQNQLSWCRMFRSHIPSSSC